MSATWYMLGRCARRRGGLDETWTIFSAEVLPHDPRPDIQHVYKVGIGVPRVLTKGPHAGRPKWDGPRREDWIPESEVDAEAKRYEAETGNCADCCGVGKTAYSWSVIDGTKYRDCRGCNGTGRAL